MSLESQVRNEVRELAGTAIESIVGAAERERARLRIEACYEEKVAAEMLRRLPKWRLLARGIWRVKHRLRASNCAAQRAADPQADAICKAMERGRA